MVLGLITGARATIEVRGQFRHPRANVLNFHWLDFDEDKLPRFWGWCEIEINARNRKNREGFTTIALEEILRNYTVSEFCENLYIIRYNFILQYFINYSRRCRCVNRSLINKTRFITFCKNPDSKRTKFNQNRLGDVYTNSVLKFDVVSSLIEV